MAEARRGRGLMHVRRAALQHARSIHALPLETRERLQVRIDDSFSPRAETPDSISVRIRTVQARFFSFIFLFFLVLFLFVFGSSCKIWVIVLSGALDDIGRAKVVMDYGDVGRDVFRKK